MLSADVPHSPPSPDRSRDALESGLAKFLLSATVLLILFAGTFPFDFSIPPDGLFSSIAREFDTRWWQWDPGNVDRIENLLFFMPFGFALSSVIWKRQGRFTTQIAAAFFFGALISTAIELSQVLVSFRDPSMQDIWCNTVGSVIGAAIYIAVGDLCLQWATYVLAHLKSLASPIFLGAVLAIYSIGQLAAPRLLHRPGDLSKWDTTLPLSLGDDPGLDRPWKGQISSSMIADRAATPAEVSKLYASRDPRDVLGTSVLASYRTLGPGPEYPDEVGLLKPLSWSAPAGEVIPATEPVHIYPSRSLSTVEAAAPAIARIARTSQFTIGIVATPSESKQYGPARLLTLGNGSHGFDVTLAQEDTDLTVRVRSAIRSAPDLQLHDTFTAGQTRNIVVTHNQAQIVVYVDGNERGRVEITPEAKVIWRLYPRNSFRIRIEKYGYRSYATIYRLLVFIPFAALLAAFLTVSHWKKATKWIFGISVGAGMALTLEIMRGLESASGFQPTNLLISVIVISGTIAAIMLRRPAKSETFA